MSPEEPSPADVVEADVTNPTPEVGEDVLEAMCRAHDAEQAAQMGEPSPWPDAVQWLDEEPKAYPADDETFRKDRLAAMRAALNASGLLTRIAEQNELIRSQAAEVERWKQIATDDPVISEPDEIRTPEELFGAAHMIAGYPADVLNDARIGRGFMRLRKHFKALTAPQPEGGKQDDLGHAGDVEPGLTGMAEAAPTDSARLDFLDKINAGGVPSCRAAIDQLMRAWAANG